MRANALGRAGDEGRPALLADGVRGGAGGGGDVVSGWRARRPQRDGGMPAACTLLISYQSVSTVNTRRTGY